MSATAKKPSDSIVAFGGIDWWYHNRGHSECQILKRLAGEMPVLWINSIGMRAPSPGKTELPMKRYIRKFKSTLKGLRKDPESGMWIYSPIFVPRYTLPWLRFNGWFLSLQVRLIRMLLGMRNPTAWVTPPTAIEAVERMRWAQVVFNRSDDFSRFPEADTAFIASLEKRVIKRSDHVFYTSHALMEREAHLCNSYEYLGHGVDYDRFSTCRTAAEPGPLPDEIADLPRPIVGFYGALDDYTIDKELVIATARHIHPATLLIIGPKAMDTTSVEAEPNVRYIGQIPYDDVPRYAGCFDVALMPWLMNEWIESSNPIKLREYLAVGFPIVTTQFPELAPFAGEVYAASNQREFLAGVDRALIERDPEAVHRRRAFVKNSTWDALSRRVAKLILDPTGDGN